MEDDMWGACNNGNGGECGECFVVVINTTYP